MRPKHVFNDAIRAFGLSIGLRMGCCAFGELCAKHIKQPAPESSNETGIAITNE
jgi:hypothetical protein